MTEYVDDIPDLLAHIIHKYNLSDNQLRHLAGAIVAELWKRKKGKKERKN